MVAQLQRYSLYSTDFLNGKFGGKLSPFTSCHTPAAAYGAVNLSSRLIVQVSNKDVNCRCGERNQPESLDVKNIVVSSKDSIEFAPAESLEPKVIKFYGT